MSTKFNGESVSHKPMTGMFTNELSTTAWCVKMTQCANLVVYAWVCCNQQSWLHELDLYLVREGAWQETVNHKLRANIVSELHDSTSKKIKVVMRDEVRSMSQTVGRMVAHSPP